MINRRQFTLTLSGAVAFAALKGLNVGAFQTWVSAAAAKLYRNAFVLDCNALASIGLIKEEGLQAVRESGLTVVKSTLGGYGAGFEETLYDICNADRLIEDHPDLFLKIRVPGDFDRVKQQRKLGVIYSFEAATPLEDKVDRVELFRNLGVRVMQLSYNRRSPFGVGCLDGETGGLTDLGRQAIARMNEQGVALDLSHANTQTTAEGIVASKRSPVITHTGCRAVYQHPRNKEDRELKALADKGGVIGIYMLPYLTASPKQPGVDDYMAHLEHALKVCGEDHVGVGTDVPFLPVTAEDLANMRKSVEQRKAAGVSAPGEDRPPYIPEMNTPRKMEIIADAMLKRRYSPRVVEKILGTNFRRVFREIWG